MKKIIFITGLILFLTACGLEFNGIGDTTSIENLRDENLVLNFDASIVSDNSIASSNSIASEKRMQSPVKHASCGHYHKKKYE